MSDFHVFVDTSRLSRAVHSLESELNVAKILNERIPAFLQRARDRMQSATPIGDGDLFGAHAHDLWTVLEEGVGEGRLFNPAPYLGFLTSGTQPHKITGSPILAFSMGGSTLFAPVVNHPGTQRDEAFTHSWEDVQDSAHDLVDIMAADLAHQVAGALRRQ